MSAIEAFTRESLEGLQFDAAASTDDLRPQQTAADAIASMANAEALNSDFICVRMCSSWRS